MLDLALQIPIGLDSQTMAAGEKVAAQIGASEWLGPLAPVALSPFFGLATLSGIATYGPDWLQQRSALLGDTSPLNSPTLFWTLATLAILTGPPRLSKVSKPIALATEKLEAYSAVIILIAVRTLGSSSTSDPATAEHMFLSAGWASLPLDLVMSIVAGLNIIVINAVKLFFEFLAWLTPIPFIDAVLEATNKTICIALLSLYCFSPPLAAGLDILLFVLCAMIFGWVYRRVIYYRHLVVGPVLAWLAPSWFAQRGPAFTAFCDTPLGGLPRCTLVTIRELSPTDFEVQGKWLWRRHVQRLANCKFDRESGLIIQRFVLVDAAGNTYRYVHRRWTAGDELYSQTILDTANAPAS